MDSSKPSDLSILSTVLVHLTLALQVAIQIPTAAPMDQRKPPMAQLRALTAPAVPKHPMVLKHLTVAAAALHTVEAGHMAAVLHMEARLLMVLHTSMPTAQLLIAIQSAQAVDMVTGPERITSMSLLLLNTLK